jgi:hypothetical protein
MILRLNKTPHRLLTLLFVFSFLLNIQTSYACAMMPDMEQEKTECCCGPSHRMDDKLEHSDRMDMPGMDMAHAGHIDPAKHEHGPICNDPQMACCNVEVSVGINDPPGDEAVAIATVSKLSPHKLLWQLDNVFVVAVFVAPASFISVRKINHSAIPPNPYLQYYGPPLYKTTERYRI